MRGWIAACMLAGTALTAVAASGQSAETTVSVREAMADHINPSILGLWDVTNAAMSDDGGIDPELMDDSAWDRLAEAATGLHAGAAALSDQPHFLVVTGKDTQPVAESVYTAEEIQGFIDADPEAFRDMARALSITAANLAEAARSQDAERAGELAGEVNALCETCHQVYWYPG